MESEVGKGTTFTIELPRKFDVRGIYYAQCAQMTTTTKGKKGLRRKLIVSMLLVGAVPLAIGLIMAFFQGTKEIREVSGTSFEALATETARKIDLILSDELSKILLQITTDVNIIQDPGDASRSTCRLWR